MKTLLISVFVICWASACSDTSFQGNSDKHSTPAPAGSDSTVKTTPTPAVDPDVTLHLSCQEMTASQTLPAEVHYAAGSTHKITVTGEVCPEAVNNLTVLFVVDWSGSMADNDPVVAGGCGRLAAANAILNAITQVKLVTDSVNVGLIGFAGPATLSGAFKDIAQFKASVTAATFCKANGGTNYVGAFQAAQAALSPLSGRKVVYFISDGQPTSMINSGNGSDSQLALYASEGIKAAQAMRAAVSDLTMNGLLLGADGAAARQILVSAIGSADHVRVASSASALATEIAKFPEVALVDGSTKVTQKQGSDSLPLTVASFLRTSVSPPKWEFQVGPFPVTLDASGIGQMAIDFQAQAADGHTVTSKAMIKVLPQ